MGENFHFPSGENKSEYQGWESWSYQDLAWQYARRNKIFQEKCLALNADDPDVEQQKNDIANEFFFNRYKDFREERLASGEGVSAYCQISRAPNGTADLRFSRTLKHHQVAIVFDLRPSLYSQDALDRQIELATKKVEKRVANLLKLYPDIRQLPSPTIDLDGHLIRLRTFDLKQSGNRSWKEIGEILREAQDRRDCDSIGETARTLFYKDAKKYVEFGYIALVTSKSTRSKIPKDGS